MKKYKLKRTLFRNLEIDKIYIMTMKTGRLTYKSEQSLMLESIDGTENGK